MSIIKKHIRQIPFYVVCLFLMAGVSCKKLIEIPPNAPDKLVESQVFADSADATAAVIQLYPGYSFVALGLRAGGYTVYPALSADELKTSTADNTLITACYINNILATNSTLQGYWSGWYSPSQGGIYQANVCISDIKVSSTLSASLKNQLIGEAEVDRAFLYFNMVNWFGGVPLVLSTDYLVNQSLPRVAETAIYQQIISDLTDAKLRLQAAYPSDGRARPNLYTASALLAKVYLYTKDWKDAATEASLVINSGLYSLEDDLNNVFLRGSNEAIWQVQSYYSTVQTTEGTIFVPKSATIIPKYFLTSFLLNAFEPGDKRFTDWVKSNNVSSGGSSVSYSYPYKYKNNGSTEDYMLFRLGEQYLIRAEAESANGDNAAAVNDLNVIRSRAGLAAYNGPDDADSVQTAIMHERQVELFCELGNRWFDLKRTGKVNEVLSAEKPGWPSDGHATLYPIPESEIEKNAALTQNTGY
jgi:starch-binding outer membrane protein, SusD/RagB family